MTHNTELDLGIPSEHNVWMREYWDRYIRDEDHFHSAIRYIHNNPVQAKLCQQIQDWQWSSAFPRERS